MKAPLLKKPKDISVSHEVKDLGYVKVTYYPDKGRYAIVTSYLGHKLGYQSRKAMRLTLQEQTNNIKGENGRCPARTLALAERINTWIATNEKGRRKRQEEHNERERTRQSR
jgi:hypothetical protein